MYKILMVLHKCSRYPHKLFYPYVCLGVQIYTPPSLKTHINPPSWCINKSEMKWIYLIRKSKKQFYSFLFTYIMWFLKEWDLNYYDLFSIGVRSCAFYILIWRFKKLFAIKNAISLITLWNTVHLKIECI